MLTFIATDLQLYKIFKITRISFFGTQCSSSSSSSSSSSKNLASVVVINYQAQCDDDGSVRHLSRYFVAYFLLFISKLQCDR